MLYKTYIRNTAKYPISPEENPFWERLIKNKIIRPKRGRGKSSPQPFVDKRKYVKLFIPGLIAMENLPPAERRLMRFILENMDIGCDYFFLSQEASMRSCGFSRVAALHDAVTGLLDAKIISRADKYKFWINPDMIFVGAVHNSLKEYKQNILLFEANEEMNNLKNNNHENTSGN